MVKRNQRSSNQNNKIKYNVSFGKRDGFETNRFSMPNSSSLTSNYDKTPIGSATARQTAESDQSYRGNQLFSGKKLSLKTLGNHKNEKNARV